MSVITVSSAAALTAAVASAASGDTILLAPGVYGTVNVVNARFEGGLTIAAADPNAPAVINYLNVTNSAGVTFEGLEIAGRAKAVGVGVTGSTDIRFERMDFHGIMDADYTNDGGGISIKNSSGVVVANSQFHELGAGIAHSNAQGLQVLGNSFYNLRSDGVSGSGSSGVRISGNTFTNFYPEPNDHPDAIQFWTSVGGEAARDITITDNVIIRGEGRVMQGVFLGNEADIPYVNVTITGNAVIGSMYNGIYVSRGQGVQVLDNVVVGYRDMMAWIQIKNTTEATIAGNITSSYVPVGGSLLTAVDNRIVPLLAHGDTSLLQEWLVAHPGAVAAATRGLEAAASEGSDVLRGAALGGETINGGGGDDTLVMSSGVNVVRGDGGDDRVTGGTGFDDLNGNAGNDTVSGAGGDDWVLGGKGDDSLSGGDGADIVNGNLGSDTAVGGAGADTLRGGQGADLLTGGAGDDWISGDRDDDTLSGGAGADVFHSFGGAGADYVTDFNAAEGDRILLDAGTTFAVAQVGADVVVSLGGGGQMTLAGVSMTSLTAGWIVIG